MTSNLSREWLNRTSWGVMTWCNRGGQSPPLFFLKFQGLNYNIMTDNGTNIMTTHEAQSPSGDTTWERLAAALMAVAIIVLCFMYHEQRLQSRNQAKAMDVAKTEVLGYILTLQKTVWEDHEQIIICPHTRKRNEGLSAQRGQADSLTGSRSNP